MQQLVEFIAKSLVEKPEDVQIRQVEGEQSIILELRVAPEDMGRIIGKQGHIARAIRVLVKAAAARQGKRVMLEIL